MGESLILDGHPFTVNLDRLQRCSEARRMADELESFINDYPDRELQRKTGWVIKRLREISGTAD